MLNRKVPFSSMAGSLAVTSGCLVTDISISQARRCGSLIRERLLTSFMQRKYNQRNLHRTIRRSKQRGPP